MSKFSFNDASLKILSNFATINPSMIIEPDKLSVISITKSTIATYKFDTPYTFDKFGIYDVSYFLSFISAMKKPLIEVKDNALIVTSESDSLTYLTTPEKMILKAPDVNVIFKDFDFILDFALPSDRLAVINKMASILKAKYIFFETDDKRIRITISDELQSSTNYFELFIEDGINANKLTEPVCINISDFKVLAGEYQVKITSKTVKGKNKYFSVWKNLNGVDYYISAEAVKCQ